MLTEKPNDSSPAQTSITIMKPNAKLVAATGAIALVGVSHGEWARPTDAPIDKLFQKVRAGLQTNPKNAGAHYYLGRLHSLRFGSDSKTVPVYNYGPGFKSSVVFLFPQWLTIQVPVTRKPGKLTQANKEDLLQSISHYKTADELDVKNSLYTFGLAWMLEQGAPFAKEVPHPRWIPGQKADAKIWLKESLRFYRLAFEKSYKSDLKGSRMIDLPERYISEQAANGIFRILKSYPDWKSRSSEISDLKQQIKKLPRSGGITPIIFPANGFAELNQLTNPNSVVRFDLRGLGVAENWSWVNANAILLVWDPLRTGRITSGRQLFGNGTWFMFWNNGYEPLAMLDMNNDGWLRGEELRGIRGWQDINVNAVSESGEVRELSEFGVMAICSRPKTNPSGGLSCGFGIERPFGRVSPSYDWVSSPVGRN